MENKQSDDLTRSFAAIKAGRAAAADRLVNPVWYHPILGLMAGGYFVALTLGDLTTYIVAFVLFAIGLPLLVSAYRKQTGMWIWGFGAGKASRWTILLMMLMFAGALGMFYFHNTVGIDWPVWVLGVVIFVLVNVLGRQFDNTVRNQLRTALDSPAGEDEQ